MTPAENAAAVAGPLGTEALAALRRRTTATGCSETPAPGHPEIPAARRPATPTARRPETKE